jgi:hypothetical protein
VTDNTAQNGVGASHHPVPAVWRRNLNSELRIGHRKINLVRLRALRDQPGTEEVKAVVRAAAADEVGGSPQIDPVQGVVLWPSRSWKARMSRGGQAAR